MPSRRILVVDDEENIGRSLRMILEREGYQVNTVRSASEMRSMPERARMDLYLVDVRLPDANGIDILRELQSAEVAAPVVMISGHATIADAVEATRAGAFDFLEKPLGRDRVMVAVKNALEHGKLPTLKDFEAFLRDEAGFSKTQAAAIAGKGLSHLLRQREADSQNRELKLADLLAVINPS